MHWMRRHRRGRPPHPDVLTPAEWRVLEQIRLGRTNAEIAVRTGLSINTVRTHLSSIYSKTSITDREALRRWDGRPAAASQAEGRPRALAWLTGGAAGGAKVAVASVVAVAFLGALFLVFSVFAEDRATDGAFHSAEARFEREMCGIEVIDRERLFGDEGTWECFRARLERGEYAQALRAYFPLRYQWTERGNGTAWLLTGLPDGPIDVIETAVEAYIVVGQQRYSCARVADVDPEGPLVFDGCSQPVEIPLHEVEGLRGLLCGIEIWRIGVEQGEAARECLQDALARGSPAQLFVLRFFAPGFVSEAFTVVGPHEMEVLQEYRDPQGMWGRYRLSCSNLEHATWQSDCTEPRLAEGPPVTCGTDLVVANREFGDQDASWACLREAWERGVPAQTFITTLTAHGHGTSRLYVTGRGSLEEEGYRFNYGVIEVEFEDFVAVGRTYYWACGQDGADEPGVDDCMGRPYRTAGLDRSWEPMRPGGAVLCGVEVVRERAHVNREARQCLLEAFEAGNPAQMLAIRFSERGAPVSEVITAYEPGVFHVYRDSHDRSDRPGVSRSTCRGMERVGAPRVFELRDCEPVR